MASNDNSVSEEGVHSLLDNNACVNQELLNLKMKECCLDGAALASSSVSHVNSDLQNFECSNLEDLSVAFASILQVRLHSELLSDECINSDRCQISKNNTEIEIHTPKELLSDESTNSDQCQISKNNTEIEIHTPKELLSDESTNSDQCQIISNNTETGIHEVKFNLDLANQVTTKRLGKSATFPSSENRNLHEAPTAIDNSSLLSDVNSTCQCSEDSVSIKAEKATCARSLSLPSALKLVSAMKGGREQHGLPQKANLSVKWAPDVYDPPATSMSHSVKNHQQRPKAKKDKHKQKNKGSRSTRGNGSDKQRSSRKLSAPTDPLGHIRLLPPPDRMLLNSIPCTDLDMATYSTNTSESKCGTGFLVETLAKLRYDAEGFLNLQCQ